MDVKLSEGWKEVVGNEFSKEYFQRLVEFVKQQYLSAEIYPKEGNIFRALDRCQADNVKVVIIGQDPYHGPGQANGLCFSVGEGVAFPPSLRNIFKEVCSQTGVAYPTSGNLERWADQGVLLLNAVLTVRSGEAASHSGKGWEEFTDSVVRGLNHKYKDIVYMLWGAYAQRKGALVDARRNLVLRCAHPSPLSAHNGFFGCGHFTAANDYLSKLGKDPIVW